MLNVPNILSLSRFFLALAFLQHNAKWRALAIFLAMFTDFLDGFIARQRGVSNSLGALLDPIADKFFVIFSLSILYQEYRITLPEIAAMLCRDFSVFLFGCYLLFKGRLLNYQYRSILCGKVATSLQFFVLFCLTFYVQPSSYIFISFIVLGILALFELYMNRHVKVPPKDSPIN